MTQGVAVSTLHPSHDYMMFVLPRKWHTDIFPISPAGHDGRGLRPIKVFVSYRNSVWVFLSL